MNLITGATGIVGSHVLAELLKKNQKCVALYRKETRKQRTQNYLQLLGFSAESIEQQIDWKTADLLDPEALEQTFEGINRVYHCAARVAFAPGEDVSVLETNIKGTALMIDLALKYKIEKFAFVSSIAALGALHGGVLDEKNQWNPEGAQTAYAWSKYLSEMEVWRGQEEGLNCVIVNPGIILTDAFWRRSSGAFTHRAKKENSFYPPAKTGFVTATEVARALTTLMFSEIQGERFILVAVNKTYKEIFKALATPWRHQGPRRRLHKFWLWVFFYVEYLLSIFKLKKRALSKGLIANLFSTASYNGTKIEQMSSFRYTPWDESIQLLNSRTNWGQP